MAVNGEVTLDWADGQHKFNVAKLRCYLELEEKCNCGVAEIYWRLLNGKWKFNDIRETLRLGLIGAGTDPGRALVLVNRYVDDVPLANNLLHAQAVIMAAIVGVQGDDIEKKATTDRAQAERSSKTESSSAPSSMASEPPSDSRHVN